MEELLDEETKKLMEELEKLLKENADPQQLQKTLDKLNQNSKNLEKELERTLELFKQLQFDYKLDQAIQDIKKQGRSSNLYSRRASNSIRPPIRRTKMIRLRKKTQPRKLRKKARSWQKSRKN